MNAQTSANPSSRPTSQAASNEAISNILMDRPEVPVTPSKGQPKARPPRPALPAEGTVVTNARCTMEKDPESDWLILKFEDTTSAGEEMQLWVLPCDYLSQMETLSAGRSGTHFKVSGTVKKYDDRAFIMLQKVLIEPASPAVVEVPATKPVAPAQTEPATQTQPASQAVATAPTAAAEADVSPEAIVAEMRSRPTPKYVPPVAEHPMSVPKPFSVVPANAEELTPQADGMVIDRVVRIIEQPSTGWWTARFVDNTLQDPPLRLLPCALLQKAEFLIDGPVQPATKKRRKMASRNPIPNSLQFRITGVVKQYNGHRYLLLEKCTVERDMDQF